MIARLLQATAVILLLVFAQPGKAQTAKPFTYVEANKASYLKLADETDAMLRRDILSVWFPRTIDNENGGFYSEFTREWEPTKSLGKFSVFQGRMTWISAQIVMHRPDLKEQYLPYVKHGVDYLNDVLWDKQYGGFYWGLDDKGQTNSFYTDGKHLYGISFGLYGAAAAYQATHDPKALELAKRLSAGSTSTLTTRKRRLLRVADARRQSCGGQSRSGYIARSSALAISCGLQVDEYPHSPAGIGHATL